MKTLFVRWQANFVTGLAVVLPAVISIAVILWLFGTVSNITDTLLFFVPTKFTHQRGGEGPMFWYWSLSALLLAVFMVGLIGWLARHYFGMKMIEWVDSLLLHVPLLNKIYGTLKQINDAFTSSSRSSFKQVVLVQFPRPSLYCLGFITSEENPEVQAKTKEKALTVFVPTTPTLTSGFLLLLPEREVTKLEMPVTDGIKFIFSLGAVAPHYSPVEKASLPSPS